jgi:putative phosphoribosyl transferase
MKPRSNAEAHDALQGPSDAGLAKAVRIGRLDGDLVLPARALGLVLFAHGSGSSRLSVRNREVARVLKHHRLGTLLFDLLDNEEAGDRALVFDIPLLGSRLTQAIDWAGSQPALAPLPIGLFGASTGAAAALVAAARRPGVVAAVVSRGGRPDLAMDELPAVQAPTLLIVGAEDREVLELNRAAARALRCPWQIELVPRATHLFQEAGALERVAALAAAWFETRFATAQRPPAR